MKRRSRYRLYCFLGIFVISFLCYIKLLKHMRIFYITAEPSGYYLNTSQDHIVFDDTNLFIRTPKFGCNNKTSLLIGVRIAASDRIQRNLIRSNWGDKTNFKATTKLIFLLAKDKVNRQKKHFFHKEYFSHR